MQIILERDAFTKPQKYAGGLNDFWARDQWPSHWIGGENNGSTPRVWAFRCCFSLEKARTIRVSVTADERYILFLDGEIVGRGSERGDLDHWFYETYDFDLEAGEHVFVAQVWALGDKAPGAQLSGRAGFLFAPHDESLWTLLATGTANWEVKTLTGYNFLPSVIAGAFFASSVNLQIDAAAFCWGFERGEGDDWKIAPRIARAVGAGYAFERTRQAHWLQPGTLPPQMNELRRVGKTRFVSRLEALETTLVAVCEIDNITLEIAKWNDLLRGKSAVIIAPHTRHRVLVDLESYYCAYPEIVTTEGRESLVRVAWAESLYDDEHGHFKGHRDEIEGKYFRGLRDDFLPDGGAHRAFTTLWWQCGRFVEIVIETQNEPLVIESFALRETRYPLEMESDFACDDERVLETVAPMFRALQMCSHETFMDCPYYEQLQYIGDTRLEILTCYATTRDDRLARKALQTFSDSVLASGLTQSRYPSRVRQVIPPFSLWFVNTLHDFLMYRGDLDFVRQLAPNARRVLDAFRNYRNEDGLVQAPRGWNFVDWVPAWRETAGMPPEGEWGVSSIINLQLVLALDAQAQIEDALGETLLAQHHRATAENLMQRIVRVFWDEDRGLFADDASHWHFSEHAQCLAILSGRLDNAMQSRVGKHLIEDGALERTTIYFSHYLFEALRVLERADVLFEKLEMWFELKARGFVTTFESPEPSRSDCHAWGAHPLFHYYSTVLGVRPTSAGFSTLDIRPQFAHLTRLGATLVHPGGEIVADLRRDGERLIGDITLPVGVSGLLWWNNRELALNEGAQTVKL